MNRWLSGLSVVIALAAFGCATAVDEGVEEPYSEETNEPLDVAANEQAQSGQPAVGNAREMTATDDGPGGPSPYPWDPYCNDPNEKPSPYPWETEDTSGSSSGSGSHSNGN